jgi:hypothetical protein
LSLIFQITKEITLIEQTILFCKNLVQTKPEDKKV